MADDPEQRPAQMPLDPAAHYAEMRAQCPMSWRPDARAWFATTHDVNYAGLRAADTAHMGIIAPWLSLRDRHGLDFPASIRVISSMPFNYEGPQHTRLRRLAATAVAPFADRRDLFLAVARRLLEAPIRDGQMDFAEDFANRLLFEILCDACAIDPADRGPLYPLGRYSWAIEATLSVRDRRAMNETVATAFTLLADRVPGIIARHSDSLLAVLHDAMPDDEPDPVGSAIAMLGVFFLMGNDALGGSLSSGVAWLLDPSRSSDEALPQARWPEVADEVFRYAAPVDYLTRIFHKETTLGGVDLAPGDAVMFSPLAANRDPARFGPDADKISAGRKAGVGLAFGAGRHLCVGMAMSRNIAACALAALAEAPPLRLAGPVMPGRGSIIRTIASMPVTIG